MWGNKVPIQEPINGEVRRIIILWLFSRSKVDNTTQKGTEKKMI